MKLSRTIISPRRQPGFTVLEMLVSVTLLGVIVFGLYAMFNQSARALRQVTRQSEVFDGGRATMGLVAREVQDMVAAGRDDVTNALAYEVSRLRQVRPTGPDQVNVLQDIFFVTRQNDTWTGTGYRIDTVTNGVGTLYRFTTNSTADGTPSFLGVFEPFRVDDFHLVAEGVIHFQMLPFDAAGRPYTNITTTNLSIGNDYFAFAGTYLPAYVELELGILEPQTLRQFKSFAAPSAAQSFLEQQAGKVQLFRQRIPIRNHHEP